MSSLRIEGYEPSAESTAIEGLAALVDLAGPEFRKLELISCPGIGPDKVSWLFSACSSTARLHTLVLRDQPLDSMVCNALAGALDMCTTLEHVGLCSCEVLDGRGLSGVIHSLGPSLPSLLRIDVRHQVLEEGHVKSLAETIAHAPRLQTLRMDGTRLGAAGALIASAAIGHASLLDVDLGDTALQPAAVRALAAAVRESSKCRLSRLRLASCACGDSSAYAELLEAVGVSGSLWDLDVSGCGLDGTAVAGLCTRLSSGSAALGILRIHNNPLEKEGVVALAEALASGGSRVREADLSSTGGDGEDMRPLLHGLAANPSLSVLCVRDCGLGSREAEIVAQSLTTNTRLRELDLSVNPLGPKGGNELAFASDEWCGLCSLKVAHAGLGEEAVSNIGGLLGDFASLQELEIAGNAAGEMGMRVLAAGVRDSASLVRVDVWERGGTGLPHIDIPVQEHLHQNRCVSESCSAVWKRRWALFSWKICAERQERASWS